nr:heme-binding protein [Brevundimonas sp. Root1423]
MAQTGPAPAQTPNSTTIQPARAPAPPGVPHGAPLSYEQAERVMAAAIDEGRRRNLGLTISIVEPTGEPIAFGRMTGAGYGSADIALAKARTAARFGRETRVLADALAAGQLWPLAIDGLIPVEGGVPIVVDGRTVGAIGVSGASALTDGDIARLAEAAAG